MAAGAANVPTDPPSAEGEAAGQREHVRDGDAQEKREAKARETEALKADLAGHPTADRATSGLDAASATIAGDAINRETTR